MSTSGNKRVTTSTIAGAPVVELSPPSAPHSPGEIVEQETARCKRNFDIAAVEPVVAIPVPSQPAAPPAIQQPDPEIIYEPDPEHQQENVIFNRSAGLSSGAEASHDGNVPSHGGISGGPTMVNYGKQEASGENKVPNFWNRRNKVIGAVAVVAVIAIGAGIGAALRLAGNEPPPPSSEYFPYTWSSEEGDIISAEYVYRTRNSFFVPIKNSDTLESCKERCKDLEGTSGVFLHAEEDGAQCYCDYATECRNQDSYVGGTVFSSIPQPDKCGKTWCEYFPDDPSCTISPEPTQEPSQKHTPDDNMDQISDQCLADTEALMSNNPDLMTAAEGLVTACEEYTTVTMEPVKMVVDFTNCPAAKDFMGICIAAGGKPYENPIISVSCTLEGDSFSVELARYPECLGRSCNPANVQAAMLVEEIETEIEVELGAECAVESKWHR